jgi:hypothetical protein
MPPSPSVLLLDDGELDDVRGLLDGLGADYLHLRGGAIPDSLDPPSDLFIATSRRAMVASTWPSGSASAPGPVKIGIVNEDSNTLRGMLRRIGFDLLVRRPVHPYALRLLIVKALYMGDERRREERTPVGCEISYRQGLRRRTAVLADLSSRGCRLLSNRLLPVGTRISLQIPAHGEITKPVPMKGKVVRAFDGGHGAKRGEYTIGVVFEGLTPATKKQIQGIQKALAAGPATLPKDAARELGATAPEAPPELAEPAGFRPLGESAAFERLARATALDPRAESAAPGAPAAASRAEPPEAWEDAAENEASEATPGIPAAAPASPADRRKHPRAAFGREVVSLDEEASCVLVGRDLSVGGMRVEPNPDLVAGHRMRLAIYGAAREEPFMVTATVLRNDGDRGVAIQFDTLGPSVAARLEALVARLPAVESLHDGEQESVGTVVSQILGDAEEI